MSRKEAPTPLDAPARKQQRKPAKGPRSRPVEPARYVPCPTQVFVKGHSPIALRVAVGVDTGVFHVHCGQCKARSFLGQLWEVSSGYSHAQILKLGLMPL